MVAFPPSFLQYLLHLLEPKQIAQWLASFAISCLNVNTYPNIDYTINELVLCTQAISLLTFALYSPMKYDFFCLLFAHTHTHRCTQIPKRHLLLTTQSTACWCCLNEIFDTHTRIGAVYTNVRQSIVLPLHISLWANAGE